jgi:hypothetical protein
MQNKPTPYINHNNPDDIKRMGEETQEKKAEREHNIEMAAEWLLMMLEKKEKYSERIPLKRDRSFDVPENITELPSNISQLVRTAHQMEYSQKGLYDLTKKISQKHQELRFSFELGGDDNKWIEYSVQKQNLNIGDEVFWENSGLMQWKEPKKIRSIQEDPKSKRKFAFVEDVTTGIPIDELSLNPKRQMNVI